MSKFPYTEVNWIWRDIKENMWLGKNISLNNPSDIYKYPFRWRVNHKRATKEEMRQEWTAIRNNGLGFKVDAYFFEPFANLYVSDITRYESGKI